MKKKKTHPIINIYIKIILLKIAMKYIEKNHYQLVLENLLPIIAEISFKQPLFGKTIVSQAVSMLDDMKNLGEYRQFSYGVDAHRENNLFPSRKL